MPQELMEKRVADLKKKFLSSVTKTKSCWLWNGIKTDGYGVFYNPLIKKCVRTHRFSYELFVEKIKSGMCVCHKCDVRNCVNPKHLYQGTLQDNNNDATNRDRWAKGQRASLAKLRDKDIPKIRKMIADKKSNAMIARMYSVSNAAICLIKYKKCWQHIKEES